MNSRYLITLALTIVLTSTALASNPVSVAGYLRQSKQMCTSLSLEQIKSEPGIYKGKVLELRGKILGYAESENGISMMISENRGDSYCIKLDGRLSEEPGTQIACLVKIGPESECSLSDLKLIAWTYEVDVMRHEESVRKAVRKAPASRAKTKARTELTGQPDTADEYIRIYAKAIRGFNSKLSTPQAEKIAQAILGFSQNYKLDPRLVMAVIVSESHFRTDAVSYAGAMGLGQLMPSTAAGLGVNNAFDPVDNLYGSIRYIRSMIDRTSGKTWDQMTWDDLSLALAAYNAGPNAVKKHGGVPPYRQTRNYVKKVTSTYKKLCGIK